MRINTFLKKIFNKKKILELLLCELKLNNGRKWEAPFLVEMFEQSADIMEENTLK